MRKGIAGAALGLAMAAPGAAGAHHINIDFDLAILRPGLEGLTTGVELSGMFDGDSPAGSVFETWEVGLDTTYSYDEIRDGVFDVSGFSPLVFRMQMQGSSADAGGFDLVYATGLDVSPLDGGGSLLETDLGEYGAYGYVRAGIRYRAFELLRVEYGYRSGEDEFRGEMTGFFVGSAVCIAEFAVEAPAEEGADGCLESGEIDTFVFTMSATEVPAPPALALLAPALCALGAGAVARRRRG